MKKSKTVIGDIYNDLIVIEKPFIKKQGNTSRYFAKVLCKCGNKIIANCSKLRDNSTKKCPDCSFKHREMVKIQVSQMLQLYRRHILYRSKDKILVEITLDQYIKLATSNCYYCGNPPEKNETFETRKYTNTKSIYINGVDRKDPNIGYVMNNCVPCCKSCNYAKHILTEKEFYDKIIKIYKIIIKRI